MTEILGWVGYIGLAIVVPLFAFYVLSALRRIERDGKQNQWLLYQIIKTKDLDIEIVEEQDDAT